jgi:hypothetical protein
VVLANLASATPAEIIERLQAADVDLDPTAGEQGSEGAEALVRRKTESILKCIEYSHSNLSDEAQALLLCLAPFTGVVNTGWLEQYTGRLKAQPALAELPYERWPAVLLEAINWGLLQHEQLVEMDYLRLQPIFPYFLKTRLNDTAQTASKQAIEAAFREHYNVVGGALVQAIQSKEAQERQVGQDLIRMEYENLFTSLAISLQTASLFFYSFEPMVQFLRLQKSSKEIESLCVLVLEGRSVYSNEQLAGEVGEGFSIVNDRLARTAAKKHLAGAQG